MDDGAKGSKTLELTTVTKNQDSVQIHLYRSKESSPDQAIDSAEYIGTLFIEDLAGKPAGIPTIKLKLTLDGAGDLSAEAMDADSGTHQSLNVSLKNLSGETIESFPDFDITGVDAGIESESFDFSGLDDIGFESEDYLDSAPAFGEEDEESASGESLEDFSLDDSDDSPFSDTIDFSDSAADFGSSSFDPDPETPESIAPFDEDTPYISHEKERKGVFVPAWMCVLILVVGISLLAAALIFGWKLFSNDSAAGQTPAIAESSAVSEPAQPTPVPQLQPAPLSAPATSPREASLPPAPSQELPAPATSPHEVSTPPAPSQELLAPATSPHEVSTPPAPSQELSAVSVQEEPTPPPVWQENADVVAAEPAPPAIPEPAPVQQNVYYLIKWGDTLWDLAEAYYRNPWRYSRIAQYNNIRDPNLIITGTYLVIPAE